MAQIEAEPGALLARYYDLDLTTDSADQPDLDLYLALARATDGPILELAVGSGRIAAPLAAAGHRVTGVDRDQHMLARAKARSAALELIAGDISDIRLGRRFELVILALNSLLLLPGRPAQATVLTTIAAHLAPAGRAVLDVWLPTPADLALYDGQLRLDWLRTDPETKEQVAKTTAARYHPGAASAEISSFFDAWPAEGGRAHRIARVDDVVFVGYSELVGMAEAAGLAIQQTGGDYDLSPFAPDSDRAVLICGLR